MTSRVFRRSTACTLLCCGVLGVLGTAWAQIAATLPTRAQVTEAIGNGNFRDALDAAVRRLDSTATAPEELPADLADAVQCLTRLNRVAEFDTVVESAVDTRADNWRLMTEAARQYRRVPHYGHRISGEFERGPHRGGGRVVYSVERDRVRALQLLTDARDLADADQEATAQDKAEIAWRLADAVMDARSGGASWRLQVLTDLTELPDYEENWDGGGNQAAPVDADNKPVFYALPGQWDDAQNDGERWRWALDRMTALDADRRHTELLARADFLRGQFGVPTLGGHLRPLLARAEADDDPTSSIYLLHTLEEDETIARLATGIQRFGLPAEHNFVGLYQRALELAQQADSAARLAESAERLARLFADRRQYPRAAEQWRLVAEHSPHEHQQQVAREQLSQIETPLGQFETTRVQPSETGATFEYRFRNATQVEFTAHAINVQQLLADVKAYLKDPPRELDWTKIDVDQIGHRLVHERQEQYVGDEVARWTVDLEPEPGHRDRRMTVTSPLQQAGAYLVTASLEGGNTAKIVLWVADTAIVKKPMEGQTLYYVADAVSGRPVAKANLELFAYRAQRATPDALQVDVKQFAEATDDGGQVVVPIDEEAQHQFQWLAVATTPEGRLAYLGFHRIWPVSHAADPPDRVQTFAVTDRPVYRPGQTVHYKMWVARARYDAGDQSEFAHKTFQIEIHDPRGEQVLSRKVTANAFGGVSGEYQLPSAATLGQYRVTLVNYGSSTFRVEEYKKPEFEVNVEAPSEPIALGDVFDVTVEARYYFGEPVREGTVQYKVTRTTRDQQWFPPQPWDWLYGPGYWWFGSDYAWYPGWQRWGCVAPRRWWIWHPPQPPEVVAEGTAPLDADGKLRVPIDSSLAKALHPDHDHQYRIEAEVTDRSRRTIVGTGSVLAAREPFNVYVWPDRGHYRTGDTITARLAARRPDGEPVEGKGRLRLLAVSYPEDARDEPAETEVRSWNLATDEQGHAEVQIKASDAGQYRLSYEVTDEQERTIEGAYVLTIAGPDFNGSDFEFNDLELVPDKRHYEPGEKVRLQVNVNRPGGTVLLYVRPVNGAYELPRVLRLEGKSTTVELDVTAADMPNVFVEAQTVAGGRVHTVARQIAVPPTKRVVQVEVAPSSAVYRPGQDAKLQIRLKDEQGRPIVGDTVLTVYDESLEYISGGSNVGEIRKAFWGWKRNHHPQTEHNLDRFSPNVVPPDEIPLQPLGAFGDVIETKTADDGEFGGRLGRGRFFADEMSELRREGATRMQFGAPMRASGGVDAAPPADAAVSEEAEADFGGEAPDAATEVTPTVRQEFADTAFWAASVETDSDGLAELEFPMPENLTRWKCSAWSLAHGTRVGAGSASLVTRKNLLVRLQTPRFLVERDEVVISANVHNYLSTAKQVRVRLELDGDQLAATGDLESTVQIEPNGEARVDWRLKAERSGTAKLRALALTDEESDAVQLEVPVKVHGIEKLIPHSGVMTADGTRAAFEVVVPEQRRVRQTRLEVQFSPTLAGAMVDALPYLIDYPYGCTEQTLNRFLPAVITQQTLRRMNVDLAAIREKQTNLNPQELGPADERAADWKRLDTNPVFDEQELQKVVKSGVQRLTEMQLSDGGWGWFSGHGEWSSPHTTAVVVRGLIVARQNEVALVPGVLEQGVEWLARYQREELAKLNNRDEQGNRQDKDKPYKSQPDNLDALVYLVLAEAERAGMDVGQQQQRAEMREHLYQGRTKLAVYSLATFGLALHYELQKSPDQQVADMRAMLLQNLAQYVVVDEENQTAYVNLPGGYWWYWYGSEFEAHAYYLKLLAATDPESDVAAGLVKYLLANRKHATYWNSTRDTALVVEAMAEYLAATGEGSEPLTVEVWLNGQRQKSVEITPEVLFSFDNRFVVEGDDIEAGRHTLEIRKQGAGRLYYNAYLSVFSLEDDIEAAGLELKVTRTFYRLDPVDAQAQVPGSQGQVISQQVEKYERTEIPNLGSVTSGDLVEVELTVESKNDYEYVVLEDLKAAGFEPVEVRSGYNGNALRAYMELRDDRVSLFVRHLARGTHSVSYRLRAETPGQFTALPTTAYAMYAPELKANSASTKVEVEDRE